MLKAILPDDGDYVNSDDTELGRIRMQLQTVESSDWGANWLGKAKAGAVQCMRSRRGGQ